MQSYQKNKFGRIINTNITALTFQETTNKIEEWIKFKLNKYVCVCNTHSIVTASNDKMFEDVLNSAGICTPDGMPLVWALRKYGYIDQDRVDGPNLMLNLCDISSKKGYRVFFYGGTNESLEKLETHLKIHFKGINIIGKYSPPFRELSKDENNEIINKINSSEADIIFVSLGCPKQEIWMYNNRNNINGIMIGVGAAFEYIIGNIKRPPLIFQKLCLEWLFRLIAEPKRLWKRYFYNNPVYIYKFFKTYKKNKKYTKLQNKLNL